MLHWEKLAPLIKFCYLPLLGFRSPSLLRGYKSIRISPVNEGILKEKMNNCSFRETVVENISMNSP